VPSGRNGHRAEREVRSPDGSGEPVDARVPSRIPGVDDHDPSRIAEGRFEREPVGTALVSPADISWGRTDVLVQPDVFVVPGRAGVDLEWAHVHGLLLAVEVLSPSSHRADRFTKRRAYQERAVPLYWIVDGDARQVEVWTPEAQVPVLERERLHWHPVGAMQPLTLPLGELFGPS
jgi:Uma2 family endonuclease